MDDSESAPHRCGARTHSGGTCRAYAMQDAHNGRCRWHGGRPTADKWARALINTSRLHPAASQSDAEPDPNRDQAPYSDAVLPGESSSFADLPVGSVDGELKLCRLRLGRAAAAEAKLIARGETDGLARIQDEINRITTRIDRFESRRAQLLSLAAVAAAAGLAPDDAADDPHALARAIRAALEEIETATAPNDDNSDNDADA